MKAKAAVGCVVLSALAIAAPQAVASEAVPLRVNTGVVVNWQPKAKTAVVVMTDQRVLVIHALRRYTPGRWVRVRGVKWGRAIAGVKWGFRPWGVKWALAMARNGTYRASLTDLGTVKHLMRLRAVVLYRNNRRLVVSVPGASWAIRFGRRAVWLPGPKLVNGAPAGFASTVAVQVRIDSRGNVRIIKARQVASAKLGVIVPIAGTVVRRSSVRRTMSVLAGGPSGVTVTVSVPDGVNMGKYPVGTEVSGTVASAPESMQPVLTGISRNGSFEEADTAGSTVGAVVPPGSNVEVPGNTASTPGGGGALPNVPSVNPGATSPDDSATKAQLAVIQEIQDSWSTASSVEPQLVLSPALAAGQAELLSLVHDSIAARTRTLAVLQLVAFELVVGAQKDTAIDPTYRAEIIHATTSLRISLLQTL